MSRASGSSSFSNFYDGHLADADQAEAQAIIDSITIDALAHRVSRGSGGLDGSRAA